MKAFFFRFALLAVFAELSASCSSSVTASRLNEVHAGMKAAEVQTLLGRPTRIEEAEITGLKGQVYHYDSSAGDARVVFVNDTVFETDFVSKGAHT